MVKEVVDILQPKSDSIYIDATIGYGGHAEKVLELSSPNGVVVGIDKDEEAVRWVLTELKPHWGKRLIVEHCGFSEMAQVLQKQGIESVDGILMDLGMSSYQVEDAERGFSFRLGGPLDMRMDRRQSLTASQIVNGWQEKNIASILRTYGEERFATRIAKNIVKFRKEKKITTTRQLAQIVEDSIPRKFWKRIHPATRTFLALRIVVNDEMENLKRGLEEGISLLKKGGRLCVISFHSLEDRIVKQTFRRKFSEGIARVSKRAILPQKEEILKNKRARSAKLRWLEKL
ncbi:MAG: 16S rRNA (cytosine(1402)-N(4))-methyltransferase RsmH [Deltaproteobacteria bacterium]|nr:16S rRNA (cytosine(1402)-N(4))-methyltransferase RsmH [Deltaproteobacteria bacterium]